MSPQSRVSLLQGHIAPSTSTIDEKEDSLVVAANQTSAAIGPIAPPTPGRNVEKVFRKWL
ncbi:hypothetical protein HDU76_006046 [Blyttiomyces sp. JEL0837]|nr:hypothetical protein HDU76_006046 [Blyttiomyces sp. JEL0837]